MDNESIPSLNPLQHLIDQVLEGRYKRYVMPAFLVSAAFLLIFFSVTCTRRADKVTAVEEMAEEMERALLSKPELISFKSMYVAEDGLYLYTQLAIEERAAASAWLEQQLILFEKHLSEPEEGELLTWIFDYGAEGEYREALVVPLHDAYDSAAYQYLNINALPPIFGDDPGAYSKIEVGLKDEDANLNQLTSSAQAVSILGQPIGQPRPTLDWFEVYETGFDDNTLSDWFVLSGDWSIQDSNLAQSDLSQYDATIQLASQPLARSRTTTTFLWQDGAFTVGLILNAPILGEVVDADFVTITNNGTLIETGYIDKNGVTQFVSGYAIEPTLDRSVAHTLQLDADAGENVLFIDGVERARFHSRRASGHLGLQTSQARFVFNDHRVVNFESGFDEFEEVAASSDPVLADEIPEQVVDPPLEEAVSESEISEDVLSEEVEAAEVISEEEVEVEEVEAVETVIEGGGSIDEVASEDSAADPELDDQPVVPLGEVQAVESLDGDFVESFSTDSLEDWVILSGDWQIIDGEYRQIELNGYDLTSVSNFTGDNYLLKVRLRLLGGVMGAGIIYNMQSQDTLAGSQMFNFTQFGKALQWGEFNAAGDFVFEGISDVQDASDGAWHDLELLVQNGQARISYDGNVLTDNLSLTYQEGYLGLLVSTSAVAFDDIQITILDDG